MHVSWLVPYHADDSLLQTQARDLEASLDPDKQQEEV